MFLLLFGRLTSFYDRIEISLLKEFCVSIFEYIQTSRTCFFCLNLIIPNFNVSRLLFSARGLKSQSMKWSKGSLISIIIAKKKVGMNSTRAGWSSVTESIFCRISSFDERSAFRRFCSNELLPIWMFFSIHVWFILSSKWSVIKRGLCCSWQQFEYANAKQLSCRFSVQIYPTPIAVIQHRPNTNCWIIHRQIQKSKYEKIT